MEKSKGRLTISQPAVKRRVSRLLSIALAIAVTVIGSAPAKAQTECLGKCEAQLAACPNQGNGSSQLSGGCIEAYEACVNACLGQYAAVLG
jgi:hypothetical protein